MAVNTPAGYYDRFDPRWARVLFRAGRFVQSAELNEIQRISGHQLEQISDSLYRDGSIVSGTSVDLNETTKKITITPGRVYANGHTHEHDGVSGEAALSYNGVGEEVVELIIEPRVITAANDPTLNDPARGAEGFNLAGADRLVFNYRWRVVDRDNVGAGTVIVAEIIDGELNQTFVQLRPVVDTVYKLLAQRTFEESGNYSVEPFVVSLEDPALLSSEHSTHLQVQIKGGVAFVHGWRIENDLVVIKVDRPTETALIRNENEIYANGKTVYGMSHRPVRRVGLPSGEESQGEIEADIETAHSLTRSALNNYDVLPLGRSNALARDVTVNTGAYVKGTDYEIIDNPGGQGSVINWKTGNRPGNGTQYNVTVEYFVQLIEGVRVLRTVTDEAVSYTGLTLALTQTDLHRIDKITIGGTEQDLNTILEDEFYVDAGRRSIAFKSGNGIANGASLLVTYEYWDHTTEGEYLSRSSFVDPDGHVLFDDPQSRLLHDVTNNVANPVNYRNEISFDVAATSQRPKVGGDIDVTYYYALPRADALLVDERGIFSISRGVAAPFPIPPGIPDIVMGVAILHLSAEARANEVTVEYFDNQRVDMAGIRTIQRMLKKLQYNQAISALYQQAIDAKPHFDLNDRRAVFADDFGSLRFADVDFDESGALIPVVYDCTVDPIEYTLRIAQEVETRPLRVAAETDVDYVGGQIFLKYDEVLEPALSQIYATGSLQVNALDNKNVGSIVVLSPRTARWVDEAQVVSETRVHTVRGALLQRPIEIAITFAMSAAIDAEAQILAARNRRAAGGFSRRFTRASQQRRDFALARNLIVQQRRQQLLDQASRTQFPDQRQEMNRWQERGNLIKQTFFPMTRVDPARIIRIIGSRFTANEERIAAFFDGRQVPLTAVGPKSTPSTIEGMVNANADGEMEATFIVPLARSGRNAIEVSGETGQGADAGTRTGSYAYAELITEAREDTFQVTQHVQQRQIPVVAQGQIIDPEGVLEQRQVGPLQANPPPPRRVFRRRRRTGDPLAQTFSPDRNAFITSIGLFFKEKPDTNEVVECIIFTTVNGFPSQTELGRASVNTVGTSDDASLETRFTFPSPVFLERGKEYAFVVKTDSSRYQVFFSEVGEQDITDAPAIPIPDPNNPGAFLPNTIKIVPTNPHTGVLLISANLRTWTARQNADLKFNMYRANFTKAKGYASIGPSAGTPAIQFAPGVRRSRFELLAGEGYPSEGTNIQWEYETDGSGLWVPFDAIVEQEVLGGFASINIRAHLLSDNTFESPVVPIDDDSASEDVLGRFYSWKAAGSYVSLAFPFDVDCRFVEAWLDVKAPVGTSVTPFVRIGNGEWIELIHEPDDDSPTEDNFTQQHYYADMLEATTPPLPGDGSTRVFDVILVPASAALPIQSGTLKVFVNDEEQTTGVTTTITDANTGIVRVTFTTAPALGAFIRVTARRAYSLSDRNCRVRIDMASNDVTLTPEVKRLRAICLEEV